MLVTTTRDHLGQTVTAYFSVKEGQQHVPHSVLVNVALHIILNTESTYSNHKIDNYPTRNIIVCKTKLKI